MNIGKISGAKAVRGIGDSLSSIDKKIELLKKQLQQIKENRNMSSEEKKKRIDSINKQIENLEKQRAEAAKNQQLSADLEKVQSVKKADSKNDMDNKLDDIKEHFDTFSHQNDSEAPGLYKVVRDENGNLTVKFDEFRKNDKYPAEDDFEKPIIMKTTVNTDSVDREIERLHRSLEEMEKKLSSTDDPKERKLLEHEMLKIQAELRQKDNEAYRRQHGQITEQKVVSRIGE